MSGEFEFERLIELCQRTHAETRWSAARAIDRSPVVRNWLLGWCTVELEGDGSARQKLYGKELINVCPTGFERMESRGPRPLACGNAGVLPSIH